jgi:hypothetical protein
VLAAAAAVRARFEAALDMGSAWDASEP